MEQFNELSHCITYFHCFNKGTQYIIFPSEKCYPFGFFCDAVKKKRIDSDKILNLFLRIFQRITIKPANWFFINISSNSFRYKSRFETKKYKHTT